MMCQCCTEDVTHGWTLTAQTFAVLQTLAAGSGIPSFHVVGVFVACNQEESHTAVSQSGQQTRLWQARLIVSQTSRGRLKLLMRGSKIWLLNYGFDIVMWAGPSPGLVCGTSFPSTNLQGQVLIIPLGLKYGIWVCLTSNWNFLFEKLLPVSKQWSVAGLPFDTNGIRNCIEL